MIYDVKDICLSVSRGEVYLHDGILGTVKLHEQFPISYWSSPEVFKIAGIRGYDPMTAKEMDLDKAVDTVFNDDNYIVEEKYDGTRALVYFVNFTTLVGSDKVKEGMCRVFSRRISKKTGFYVENSDSLPQIEYICKPEMGGTILDGEMFVNGKPFKEVSAILNSNWDKAIIRQLEVGYVTFHAFDILFYHGIDLREMELRDRKKYLHLAVEEADSEYIEEVKYYGCGDKFECDGCNTPLDLYTNIVANGGEGIMIKPLDGKYYHKRGWEYTKLKKFITRDLVIIGFTSPTKEYDGKNIETWEYWENEDGERVQGQYYKRKGYTPVTKHYFNKQVGNLILAVFISESEYEKIPEKKRSAAIFGAEDFDVPENTQLMPVCECAGFDDEMREYFTNNREYMLGKVVEVGCNEIFKDTGKLRHPRFIRMREDKNPEMCLWKSHIDG